MNNADDQNFEHSTHEIRQLFIHLVIFLVVIFVLRFWNMVMLPGVPWSSVILIIWTIFLAIHLLLFFLSTGILGGEYENVPVKVIARELIYMIKERNLSFKKNLKAQPKDTNNTVS